MAKKPVIIQNLTTVNFSGATNKMNTYIIIHWVGNVSSAKNNCKYFKSVYRGSSAHYFVDSTSIYQCVEDSAIAWHCGTKGTYYHKYARNTNSIGIEMCLSATNTISKETIERTAELVMYLMEKYNIPAENVIRHYDVTHKKCPAIYVDNGQWNKLHKTLTQSFVVNTGTSSNKSEVEISSNATIYTNTAMKSIKMYGSVKTNGKETLNIRTSPKASSPVISGYVKGLENGTPLYISGEYNKWYLVTLLNGTKGWVHSDYVGKGINRRVNTKTSPLVMRSGRGTGYAKITSIPKGTSCVQLDSYIDGWARIIYKSKVGYVMRKYLK